MHFNSIFRSFEDRVHKAVGRVLVCRNDNIIEHGEVRKQTNVLERTADAELGYLVRRRAGELKNSLFIVKIICGKNHNFC